VFVESDSLGTERPVTIGYFTKLAPEFTHLTNLHETLINQLMLTEIKVDLALKLAPHLKTAQIDAMSNGDEYVPILPNFEVYKRHLSHGHAPSQITTEVIGVKCAPKDAKLLGKFFTCMASENSTDSCDGIFLPKGSIHLLGPTTNAQVLHENNFFINNVATVPVNMEYATWFTVIDPDNNNENKLVSLHEHLLRQPWFLRIESVTCNKCLILTTKSNLPVAQTWIDENLVVMVRKSIPPGINPPSSCLL